MPLVIPVTCTTAGENNLAAAAVNSFNNLSDICKVRRNLLAYLVFSSIRL